MIPVTQTKMVVRNKAGEMVVRGNCLAAAIASMLELPITEVPNVEVFFDVEGEDAWFWSDIMSKWLKHRGYRKDYAYQYMVFHPAALAKEQESGNITWEIEKAKEQYKDNYYMVTGPSARGVDHICIYRNGELVHDPHPSRDGLEEEKYFYELVKIESNE